MAEQVANRLGHRPPEVGGAALLVYLLAPHVVGTDVGLEPIGRFVGDPDHVRPAVFTVDFPGDDDFFAGSQHVGEVADALDLGATVEGRQRRQRVAVGGPGGRLEFGDAIAAFNVLSDRPSRINHTSIAP